MHLIYLAHTLQISAVVIVDQQEAIGYQNNLLCHLPNDLKHFRQITTGHHILMGRKTFESIGKPLPNRTNMILSHDKNLQLEGCHVFSEIDAAIAFAQEAGETELMVVGGGNIYKIFAPRIQKIYYTRIHHTFEKTDAYFPSFDLSHWKLVEKVECLRDEKNLFDHTFETWEKQ